MRRKCWKPCSCRGKKLPRKKLPLLRDGLLLLLRVVDLLVLLLKAADAAFRIDQLLTAGEERMATGADFHADVALMRGAGAEGMPTGADDVSFFVSGVNSGFHRGNSIIT